MARPSKKKTYSRNKGKKTTKRKTKISKMKSRKKRALRRIRRRSSNRKPVPLTIENPSLRRLVSIFSIPIDAELPPYEPGVWNRILQALPDDYKIPDMNIVQSLHQRFLE